ncbi:hypothetical protein PISL3812_00988 [Talaromyces islandicus]|uniref:Shikimate dehydrogenase substrate binding N-terminal domain-containing protein n=1 Tax=Talaromyces islandicus TaxID=28573 RepID=A0A0U1LKS3_TALIS|nr:hypothetical protein PISL3812_00988 [Talaromyces islandicus]
MASELSKALKESFDHGSSIFDSTTSRNVSFEFPLLGFPIKHSLAPLVHNSMFQTKGLPWKYYLLESKDINDLCRRLEVSPADSNESAVTIGAAVTMPHKVSFMSHVDELTTEGRSVGAINTVFTRLDPKMGTLRRIGTNTDTIGIARSFTTTPNPLFAGETELRVGRERPALVIGGGGASRSAVFALHHFLGATEIYLVSRLKSETDEIISWFAKSSSFNAKLRAVHDLDEAKALTTPYYVVGAIPDIRPQTPGEKMAHAVTQELLGGATRASVPKGVVLEMCYHPNIRTTLYDFAEQSGWTVVPGTVAMIWQAVAQQVLWTETEFVNEMAVVDDLKKIVEHKIAGHSQTHEARI